MQLIQLEETDAFLASYPRSGNTWLRFLVGDLILQKEGVDTRPGRFEKSIFQIIPTLDKKKDLDSVVFAETSLPFRILKTHHIDVVGDRRAVYIFRKAPDTLCSYFQYLRKRRTDPEDSFLIQDIDQFSLKRKADWKKHIRKALLLKAQYPDNLVFVSYEMMMNEPLKSLSVVANFLNLEVDRTMVKKALENQNFENMKSYFSKKQAKAPNDPTLGTFLRKGKIGSAKNELKPETYVEIGRYSKKIYNEAEQILISDYERYATL